MQATRTRFGSIINVSLAVMVLLGAIELFLVYAMEAGKVSDRFPPMFGGLLIVIALVLGGYVLRRSRDADPASTADTVRSMGFASAVLIVIASLVVFLFVPTEVKMGMVQRIFYFHVGADWVGAFAFLVTLIAGIMVLRTGSRWWDIVALSSVEIGLAFITMGIVTGSIWARPIWNTWWTWSPRLTAAAIMWLVYVAYIMLRGAIEDPDRRMRFAAVYGIFGFVSVIATFLSIQLLRDIHPAVILGANAGQVVTATDGSVEAKIAADSDFNMLPSMLHTLLLSLGTFTLLYFTLLQHRIRLEQLRDSIEELKARLLAA